MPRRARRVNLRRPLVSVPVWRALVVLTSAMVVIVLAGIGYTAYVDGRRADAERSARAELQQQEREADRRWCRLLGLVTRAYETAPPATTLGEQLAAAYAELIAELGCPRG